MSYPNFRGKSNELKAKCWLLLAREYYTGQWYTSEQIHKILGVNLRSLRTALIKWCSPTWKRVLRRKRNYLYEYRLSAKGLKWFETWRPLMPMQRYMAEIEAWQSRNRLKKQGKGY